MMNQNKTNHILSGLLFVLLFLTCQPLSGSGNNTGLPKIDLPGIIFACTTVEVNLQNHPVIKDLDKPGGLVIQRRGKNSSPAEEVEFDSSGKAQLSFPEAGHYLVTLRAGDRTSSRLVRVMPGFLTILPPVLAIILALIFRQVLPALFFGIWVGTSLIAGINPWTGLLRLIDTYLVQAMTNKDHVRIIIFSMTLGGMIGLITRCGGATGLVEWFSRLAVSRRMGQLTTWLIGLLIFFDDYSNTLMVGNTMRPFTDKLKISREKLSFIVDSTAAPVASVALISTWIGFELGLLNSSISSLGLQENAYWLFLKALPYNFYSWACIIFVLMIILTRRDFGPMWRAEERAIQSGQVLDVNAQPLIDEEMTNLQPPPNTPRRWYNAIVPIGAMSVTLVVGLYKSGLDQVKASGHAISLYNIIGEADPFQVLLWAAFTGVFASFFLILIQRALTVRQSVEAFLIGFKSLTLAMIILTLARIIQLVCTELQTANYLLAISKGLLSPGLLPAITFIIASATSFSTGTSWGTMAILMPLIIPLAYYLPVNAGLPTHSVELTMVATVGAILSGAVFGDHCSPISDTTIMSSMSSGADHIDHVRTQLPYATLVALISVLFGYLPSGMGLIHPVLSIPVILLFLWLALRLLGKKLSG